MRLLTIFLLLYLSACQTIKRGNNEFYFPAEWEEQESVWLGWSVDKNIQQVHLEMAKALSPHISLTILSRSDSIQEVALQQLITAGIDTSTVRRYIHYIPNVFIRDAGPRFLKNKNGHFSIADFGWNNYGYPKEFEVHQFGDKRGEIDNALAKQMNLKTKTTSIFAEGGGIDVSTSMMLCFKEKALQRNPGKSLKQIEKAYLSMYGKQKMIWLDKMPVMDKVIAGAKAGNYFGYGANGHVDEFVRFVNDSTICIAQIDSVEKDFDPVSSIDYHILKENLAILKKATDLQGKPFHIITLPVPSYSLYVDKEILSDSIKLNGDGKVLFKDFKAGQEICWLPAVSYLNFFITNNAVLVAKYWQEGLPETERLKDEQVRQALQNLFTNRAIIQINPMVLNRYGGGMHCATQQQPK